VIILLILKVKLSLCLGEFYAMKTFSVLNEAPFHEGMGEWRNCIMFWQLYHQYSLYRSLGRPQVPDIMVAKKKKTFPAPGRNHTPAIQPIA
jgi:hypothetical protein